MRIITGKLKGRRIHIPKGLDIRPTTDRTKESIFNKIEVYKYLENSRVLDLFSGSGSLGFEAISRGAAQAMFVDNDAKNIELIQKTAEQFNVREQILTLTGDVLQFLRTPHMMYDFIFCDPPYRYPFIGEIVDIIINDGWLAEEGWLILEHDKHHNYKAHKNCIFTKAYGRTTVSIFQKQAIDSK